MNNPSFDPLGDILQATDELSRVINSYKKIVGEEQVDSSYEDQSTGGQSESGEGFNVVFISFNCNQLVLNFILSSAI